MCALQGSRRSRCLDTRRRYRGHGAKAAIVQHAPPLDVVMRRGDPADNPEHHRRRLAPRSGACRRASTCDHTTAPSGSAAKPAARKRPVRPRRKRGWKFFALVGLSGPLLRAVCAVLGYYYVIFSRMIDARHPWRDAARRSPRLRPAVRAPPRPVAVAAPAGRSAERSRLRQPARGRTGGRVRHRPGRHRCSCRGTATARASRSGSSSAAKSRPKDRPEPTVIDTDRGASAAQGSKLTDADARRAAHHRAHHRRAARSAATCRWRRSRRTWSRRSSRSRTGASTSTPASTRSPSSAPCRTNVFGTRAILRGGSTLTQQLVKNTFLTQERSAAPQDDRVVHVGRARAAAVEGADPRALSQRRVARPARVVRDPRRGRSGAAVLRQGHLQRLADRGGDDRRHHPVAAAALAVQQSRPRQRAPQRRPPRDGRQRVHQRRRRRARVARAAADRGARARSRGAVLRRLRQPGAAGPLQGVRRHRRRLHHARPAPAAGRAGRGARRADPRRRDPRQAEAPARAGGADRGRSAHRRDPGDGRRPLVQPVAVQPRHQRRAGSRARSSSRSSTSRPSSTRSRKAAPTSRRRRWSPDEPTTFAFNDQSWEPGNYDGEYDGPVTLRRALALSRNIVAIKVAEAAGYDHVAALWRKVGAGTPPRPYPSIALGVFEATPFEIASAYTIFPNGGTLHPLRAHRAAGQRRARTSRCSADAPRRSRARTRRSSSPT